MKVMTFNLKCSNIFQIKNSWNHRKSIVKNVIENLNCDVIGVQECTDTMLNDLKDMLPQYNIIGQPRSRKFFKERNCILVLKKYTINNQRTIWLSRTPEIHYSRLWCSVFPRICTIVEIFHHEYGNMLICNTHFDCYLEKTREKQCQILLKYIDNINKKRYPVILMGDFNAVPASTVIKEINRQKLSFGTLNSVTDFKRNLYFEGTRVGFHKRDKGDYIDYIFVNDDLRVLDVRLIKYGEGGRYPSDHIPVYCEIAKK